MAENYREVARKLDVVYLFGHWGINLFPIDPTGKRYKLFQIVRLDGWIFDPEKIVEAIRMDDEMGVRPHETTTSADGLGGDKGSLSNNITENK